MGTKLLIVYLANLYNKHNLCNFCVVSKMMHSRASIKNKYCIYHHNYHKAILLVEYFVVLLIKNLYECTYV